MGIAVSEDHLVLAAVVRDFAGKRALHTAARDLLEAPSDRMPDYWTDLAGLGWLGLHLPEKYGGSGYGIEELVVVVEELGRRIAPGPFVPSVIASAVIATAGDEETRSRLLPKLASGELVAAVALEANVTMSDERATGSAKAVLGAQLADVFLFPVGDDIAVVEQSEGVTVENLATIDPTRRVAPVRLNGASAIRIPDARRALIDLGKTILRLTRSASPACARAMLPNTPRSGFSSAA